MPELEPGRARQEKRDTLVLLILIAGLALSILIFLGRGIYGWLLPDSDLATDRPTSEIPAAGTEPPSPVVAPENSG